MDVWVGTDGDWKDQDCKLLKEKRRREKCSGKRFYEVFGLREEFRLSANTCCKLQFTSEMFGMSTNQMQSKEGQTNTAIV